MPHYFWALPYPDGFNIIRSIRVVQLLTIVCVILISPALIRVHNALRGNSKLSSTFRHTLSNIRSTPRHIRLASPAGQPVDEDDSDFSSFCCHQPPVKKTRGISAPLTDISPAPTINSSGSGSTISGADCVMVNYGPDRPQSASVSDNGKRPPHLRTTPAHPEWHHSNECPPAAVFPDQCALRQITFFGTVVRHKTFSPPQWPDHRNTALKDTTAPWSFTAVSSCEFEPRRVSSFRGTA